MLDPFFCGTSLILAIIFTRTSIISEYRPILVLTKKKYPRIKANELNINGQSGHIKLPTTALCTHKALPFCICVLGRSSRLAWHTFCSLLQLSLLQIYFSLTRDCSLYVNLKLSGDVCLTRDCSLYVSLKLSGDVCFVGIGYYCHSWKFPKFDLDTLALSRHVLFFVV